MASNMIRLAERLRTATVVRAEDASKIGRMKPCGYYSHLAEHGFGNSTGKALQICEREHGGVRLPRSIRPDKACVNASEHQAQYVPRSANVPGAGIDLQAAGCSKCMTTMSAGHVPSMSGFCVGYALILLPTSKADCILELLA